MQPLPFDNPSDTTAISAAPNPKPSASDKRGYGNLASLYTAFSTEFARFALDLCIGEGHRRIVDPFGGMGTVGEAGRSFPVEILLNDLNPFASLSCIFRSSPAEQLTASIERVSQMSLVHEIVPERDAFLAAVRTRIGDDRTPAELINLSNDPQIRAIVLDIHLIALIRIASHRRLRGSNPTWTKRSTDLWIDPNSFMEAQTAVLAAAKTYAGKLIPLNLDFQPSYRCSDVANLAIGDGMMDAVITSPPYPNRTDYIRHYLPAAELLVGGDADVERSLRETQIGTPLIRTELPDAELPTSVLGAIERVRTHGSYASERYYAKGFHYYFADMRTTFERMAGWLKPGGVAIFVIQETYYKEMRIPVADLLVDIAGAVGLELEGRKDFPVRHALSRLSAQARASAPTRTAVESAMLLRRISK